MNHHEREIRAAVSAAQRLCPSIKAGLADTFLADGSTLSDVREQLFLKVTATSVSKANMQREIERAGLANHADLTAAAQADANSGAGMKRELARQGIKTP